MFLPQIIEIINQIILLNQWSFKVKIKKEKEYLDQVNKNSDKIYFNN